MQTSQFKLPSYTLYRSNCHSSNRNILAYLSSTTQIRIVDFTQQNSIKYNTVIKIAQEPVKNLQILLTYDAQENQKIYVGIAFISKFMFLHIDGQPYHEQKMQLTENIVNLKNCIFSMKKYGQDKMIIMKTFGQMTIFNINEKTSLVKKSSNESEVSYSSVCIMEQNLYLGTMEGAIQMFRIQDYIKINSIKSGSNFPILHLLPNSKHKQIISSTCQGQILLLAADLSSLSVISAHHSNISRIHLGFGDLLFTVGEDSILHEFKVRSSNEITLIKSTHYKKLPSLLFSVNQKNYITFYEDPIIAQLF